MPSRVRLRFKRFIAIELEKLAKAAFKEFAASELRWALKGRSLEPLKTVIILYQSLCVAS